MRSESVLAATFFALMAAGAAKAGENLTIAVINYAGVPDAEVAAGVEVARGILSGTGVAAEWDLCRFDGSRQVVCAQPLPERYFVMNVIARMAPQEGGPAVSAELAGFALVGPATLRAPRAYAVYRAVELLAEKSKIAVTQILGCVMVHEIAHSLGLRHQPSGLMSTALSPKEVDEAQHGFPFRPGERKQLHDAAVRWVTTGIAVARR